MLIWPAVVGRSPVMTSASSRWPLPETPAIPRISPRAPPGDVLQRLGTRGRPGRRRPPARGLAGPGSLASLAVASRDTSRPTISPASSSASVPAVGTVVIEWPWRKIVTRSATASTSGSLWEMKITVRPAAAMSRTLEKSWSASCGVSTVVGSSRMRILAPR